MPGTRTGYVTNRLLLDGISDPPVQTFPRGSNPFTVYRLLFTLYPRWDKRPTCANIPPRLQPLYGLPFTLYSFTLDGISDPPVQSFPRGSNPRCGA